MYQHRLMEPVKTPQRRPVLRQARQLMKELLQCHLLPVNLHRSPKTPLKKESLLELQHQLLQILWQRPPEEQMMFQVRTSNAMKL
jgi:hypothetical protein